MTRHYNIHSENPQHRLLLSIVDELNNSKLVVVPTDCSYSVCCKIGDKAAEDKLFYIKELNNDSVNNQISHRLAIFVKDLSQASQYAKIDNWTYKILKKATPGPYTFILPANKQLPKRLQEKRKNIGIRIPDNNILINLLELYNEPLYSTTLWLPGDNFPINNIDDIPDKFINKFDAIIDGGQCYADTSTIVSLIDNKLEVLRVGRGSTDIFK